MARKKGSPTKRTSKSFVVVHAHNNRFKITRNILKQIKVLQRSTTACIPKLPFSRFVRELLQGFMRSREGFRVQGSALAALQEAAEVYLVQFFEDVDMCASHAKRITISPQDVKLVIRLRRDTL